MTPATEMLRRRVGHGDGRRVLDGFLQREREKSGDNHAHNNHNEDEADPTEGVASLCLPVLLDGVRLRGRVREPDGMLVLPGGLGHAGELDRMRARSAGGFRVMVACLLAAENLYELYMADRGTDAVCSETTTLRTAPSMFRHPFPVFTETYLNLKLGISFDHISFLNWRCCSHLRHT